MLWRLLPLLDPLVDVIMIRDLDSRPSSREVSAVSDWLNSSLGCHLMRDHPSHTWHVMGGLWGARTSGKRQEWNERVDMIMNGARSWSWLYMEDQRLFESFLWPEI